MDDFGGTLDDVRMEYGRSKRLVERVEGRLAFARAATQETRDTLMWYDKHVAGAEGRVAMFIRALHLALPEPVFMPPLECEAPLYKGETMYADIHKIRMAYATEWLEGTGVELAEATQRIARIEPMDLTQRNAVAHSNDSVWLEDAEETIATNKETMACAMELMQLHAGV